MKNNLIHFIITGGTIDSFWDKIQDAIVVSETSIVPQYIADLKLASTSQFTTVCMKDSRALNDTDLKNMLKAIEESRAQKIVITHGIFTMPDSAKYLKSHLKRKDQTIVLTGSFTPLRSFELSDAPFNLGFAVAEVSKLSPGVYICMNGKTFGIDEVTKNLNEGKFYPLFTDKQ